jgi:hypothetical protein
VTAFWGVGIGVAVVALAVVIGWAVREWRKS